mmetsp:Transcript_131667/g.328321  ORF Transcript_131667/g.328321 Transcript_131667/m.328321 type:complete len:198 (-) Transcript_131667:99-692(-)
MAAARLDDTAVSKIHSAIRWNKPTDEIEAVISQVGATPDQAWAAEDSKNGNRCLHIAAQNGHINLTRYLLEGKADVNAKNGKGQTALHMSVEYDLYFQSVLLLEHGAEATAKNAEGHEALKGIDGKKDGPEAWDNPVTILKSASDDLDELNLAFSQLETADVSTIDKVALVQAGMAKKKMCKDNWDAARFMAVMKRF